MLSVLYLTPRNGAKLHDRLPINRRVSLSSDIFNCLYIGISKVIKRSENVSSFLHSWSHLFTSFVCSTNLDIWHESVTLKRVRKIAKSDY